jgi:hypothetical protein
MQAAQEIRNAMARVAELRQLARQQPHLAQALQAIKQLQAQRFASSYADLLAQALYAPSARFFLDELYSARDYSTRDSQFARIAGAVERSFPVAVVATVLALAQLHRQTEELDHAMAQQQCQAPASSPQVSYLSAWRAVGQKSMRQWQLDTVLEVGQGLSQLTRKRGLRWTLKLMRQPAELAGLGALQHLLESGFDHFAAMARTPGAAETFLDTIRQRESHWITQLFDGPQHQVQAELQRAFGCELLPV